MPWLLQEKDTSVGETVMMGSPHSRRLLNARSVRQVPLATAEGCVFPLGEVAPELVVHKGERPLSQEKEQGVRLGH